MSITISLKHGKSTSVARQIRRSGSFEPEVVELMINLLNRPGRAMLLNIGANIGLYPLIASKYSEYIKKN
jgi:hypothetical protein